MRHGGFLAFALAALTFAGSSSIAPSSASAQEDVDYFQQQQRVEEAAEPESPSRLVYTLGLGSSLRILSDPLYGQNRFAPGFIDLTGAYVLEGRGIFRHGFGLTLSLNLSGDGNASIGVDPASQFFAIPAYFVRVTPIREIVLIGKAGIGFGGTHLSVGGELTAGAMFFPFFNGVGLYAELGLSAWLGAQGAIHPLFSFEGGLAIDYEVL